MKKEAVYAGSFDPFTVGHLHIYQQASELFDKVRIVIAKNPAKQRLTDVAEMVEAIKEATGANVTATSRLIADVCQKTGALYLIRGIRNTSDYLYEEEIAKANAEIFPELKTIYFRAKDDVISSTLVRLLAENKRDISKYVPQSVLERCFKDYKAGS